METTENSGKQPLTWSTSSHPFTTDLFISWSQTGRVSFAIADGMSSFDAWGTEVAPRYLRQG
jgi:hypothetical protein